MNKNYDFLTNEELEELALNGDELATRELAVRYGNDVAINTEEASINGYREENEDNNTDGASTIIDEARVEENDLLDASEEDSVSFEQKYTETKQLSLYKLKNLTDSGDSIAGLVFGERLFNSYLPEEQAEGIRIMEQCADMITEQFQFGEVKKEYYIGLLEKICYDFTQSTYYYETNSEKVFEYASNLYELDNTKGDYLAWCYNVGFGCTKNTTKAQEIIQKCAMNSGYLKKASCFIGYFQRKEHLNSILWAQILLADSEADDHPMLSARVKMWLSEQNETDHNGSIIDYYLAQDVYEHSEMPTTVNEVFYLFSLAETKDEKMKFASFGSEYNEDLKKYYLEETSRMIQIQKDAESLELDRNKRIEEIKKNKRAQILGVIKPLLILIALVIVALISQPSENDSINHESTSEVPANTSVDDINEYYHVGDVLYTNEKMRIRRNPNTDASCKKPSDISPSLQYNLDEDQAYQYGIAILQEDTEVTVEEIVENTIDGTSYIWVDTEYGWICAKKGNEIYLTK